MQPQGQPMQGMEMQQGQQMQSMEMAPQLPSPETQLNMQQPVQPENQTIIQQPNTMQAPAMMQNGDMNIAQPQIYEKPADEPKQAMAQAAPPPPPPPNFPPINTQSPADSGLNPDIANFNSNDNINDSGTKELINDADKAKEKLRQDVEKFKNDLTPDELEIYQEAFRS